MTGTLLEGITDMENAFLQLHRKFLFVKQSVHDMQGLDSRKIQLGKEQRPVTDDNYFDSRLSDGSFISVKPTDTGTGVEEPDALRLHQQNQQHGCMRASELHVFIRATAFGQHEEDHKYDLRMNPDWMELTTKSNRALESVATSLSTKKLEVITRSIHITKLASADKDEHDKENTLVSFASKCYLSELLLPASPHALPRMAWDVAGCFMLMIDAFTLPVTLAWGIELSSSTTGQIFLWASLSFWTLDIFANFNTGFYHGGTLHLDRAKIAKNYLSGWFIFDLFIVCLDFFLAAMPSDGSNFKRMASFLRNVRGLRALRAMRLLRLLKMRKFNVIIEELAMATGRPWLLIIMSMIKILLGLVVAAHGLSCLWYFIGASVHDAGRTSWLENTGAAKITVSGQYLHALQWLLTPPAPPPIEPGSSEEIVGNIFIVVFTLIVMGSALGKFTSALQELNAMNSEKTRKRREVRSYLQDHATSMELISRIMRFVDHRLSMQEAYGAVDLSLISPSLQMELYVNQRGVFLEKHPLFCLAKEMYPTVYAYICGAAVKHGYERHETIFQAGQFANAMIITAVGDYFLQSEKEIRGSTFLEQMEQIPSDVSAEGLLFSGIRWFAESCIYSEGMIHSLTLRANTFCDAFTLTSQHLLLALQDSPTCAYMFCEYAKDFLGTLKQCVDPTNYEQAAQVSETAVKQNNHYMELYPDPNALVENFPQCIEKRGSSKSNGEPLLNAHRFVEQTLNGDIGDQHQLSASLRKIFFELDPQRGSHATFSQNGERERSESSCLSILNLVANQYENFTRPQAPEVRLTTTQWQELRDIIAWIAPTQKEIHAVIVLLAIRSLGKSKRLVRQIPRKCRRPEAAVIYLMQSQRNVVPSVKELDNGTLCVLIETLQVHDKFNFAQMLQGENCPANVSQLHEIIHQDIPLLKFYMLFIIGFMSGLAAGEGSRFMTSKGSAGIIDGCRALRCLMSATPQAVYWSYMTARACALDIPTETPEDLALVRLACLSRVQDYSGYVSLRTAWMKTSMRSRKVLLKHFLADGITERAFVFEFLPLCISNATKNTFVRLPALLEVIVDLLDNLTPSFDDADDMIVPVELSDMAEFASVVRSRFVFQSCILRCYVRRADNRIYIEMSPANWMRTNDSETDTTAIASDVKQLLDRVEFMESVLENAGETALSQSITITPNHASETAPRRRQARTMTRSRNSVVESWASQESQAWRTRHSGDTPQKAFWISL